MSTLLLSLGTALWLGILTSISPCPLATNIAAISYIGRKAEHPKYVLLTGLLYATGRVVTYVVLAAVLVKGALSIPSVSYFLQQHLNKILGPLLIIAGMFLLDLITIDFKGRSMGAGTQERIDRMGIMGTLPLGIVFAVSFCPVSAVLFFGGLLPLATRHDSIFAVPFVYGVGTALPVLAFAVLLAFGAHWVGKAFHKVSRVEVWLRRATGVIFIGVGIYLAIVYIFLP
ncbi:MAG: aromatic aminobenezylarsenical efflux permease ArsG family transporter [Pseudomonadota bacterium]